MKTLSKALSYVTLNLSSLFEPSNSDELKQIQCMMSEGIARGYVRPLTRVTYAPSEVTRAYRLFANSSHRGRVLLNLQKDIPCLQTKIYCQSDLYHLLVSDDEILGIQLAERLISRGARNLVLHFTKQCNCLLLKLRLWKKQGITVKVSDGNDIAEITVNNKFPQNVEGIYYVDVPESVAGKINSGFEGINLLNLQLSSQLKYFAIISTDYEKARKIPLPQEKIFTTRIILPMLKTKENGENYITTPRDAADIIEEAVCSKQRVVLGYMSQKPSQYSLIKDIARVAGIELPNGISGKVTLRELGMSPFRTEAVMDLLRSNCNVTINETNILSLTVDSIRDLEQNNKKYVEKSIKGLNTFYSYVDHDELLATTEITFLPSLANNSLMKEYEFDASRKYLCVVPGIEGHHSRFNTLCERLKLPVLALQPPFHQPKITIREMAERFVKTLLKQTLKEEFILLGYERGVLVALEMASILESYGFTGTVFCIGGTPEEVKEKFDQELGYLDTEEALQEEVLRHMLTLITKKNPENLQTVLQNNLLTFEEKVSKCIQITNDFLPNSTQYAKEIILAAYSSILEIRRYVSDPKPLRSLIVYMRPDDVAPIANDKKYSKQHEVVYELQSPLAQATYDLSCPAIVNRHLCEDVHSTFEKQNILETYSTSNQLFESARDDTNLV